MTRTRIIRPISKCPKCGMLESLQARTGLCLGCTHIVDSGRRHNELNRLKLKEKKHA